MRHLKRWWLAGLFFLVLAGGALALSQHASTGYTCPLTGDTLPCPACCPME